MCETGGQRGQDKQRIIFNDHYAAKLYPEITAGSDRIKVTIARKLGSYQIVTVLLTQTFCECNKTAIIQSANNLTSAFAFRELNSLLGLRGRVAPSPLKNRYLLWKLLLLLLLRL